MERKHIATFEGWSGTPEGNKKVTIKKYSPKSKFLGVYDLKTGKLWANEKFKDEKEAKDFIKQNKLVLNENRHENQEGLNVYPRTEEDNRKLTEWLPGSAYHAEWNRVEGYWFFPEKEETQDALEMELEKEFLKLDIYVQYEGVWN